ncbi:hypothetical protein ABZ250_14060 [Streptomyces afghaniensis]|uniref:hypothetical protein n=1 Tax=Streptomyces afghaniensis TaxID=66865 RepID=UPI0033A22777
MGGNGGVEDLHLPSERDTGAAGVPHDRRQVFGRDEVRASPVALQLKAGQVVDGVKARGPGMVMIENGLIRDADFAGEAPPEYATVTDFGANTWLLPGLVDAHVHLGQDASTDAVAQPSAPLELRFPIP